MARTMLQIYSFVPQRSILGAIGAMTTPRAPRRHRAPRPGRAALPRRRDGHRPLRLHADAAADAARGPARRRPGRLAGRRQLRGLPGGRADRRRACRCAPAPWPSWPCSPPRRSPPRWRCRCPRSGCRCASWPAPRRPGSSSPPASGAWARWRERGASARERLGLRRRRRRHRARRHCTACSPPRRAFVRSRCGCNSAAWRCCWRCRCSGSSPVCRRRRRRHRRRRASGLACRRRRHARPRRLLRLHGLRLHPARDLPARAGAQRGRRPARVRPRVAGLRRDGGAVDAARRAAAAGRDAPARPGPPASCSWASACCCRRCGANAWTIAASALARRRDLHGHHPGRRAGDARPRPTPAHAAPLVGRITAAFALGQIAGPVVSALLLRVGAGGLGARARDRAPPPCSRRRAWLWRTSCRNHTLEVSPMADPASLPPRPCPRRDRAPAHAARMSSLDEAQRAAAQALIDGPRKGVYGPFLPLLRSPVLLDRVAKRRRVPALRQRAGRRASASSPPAWRRAT